MSDVLKSQMAKFLLGEPCGIPIYPKKIQMATSDFHGIRVLEEMAKEYCNNERDPVLAIFLSSSGNYYMAPNFKKWAIAKYPYCIDEELAESIEVKNDQEE